MAKRVTLLMALLLGLAGAAWAGQLQDQQAEIQDILLLAEQGISDDVIIAHIEARGFVYDLTVDDILDLRDRGLSEPVIQAMLETAVDDQPSQRERTVESDGGSTTSVYLSAGYFSPWYYYPYAWGFYYDPFPVCYGAYYYPFAFGISWGWYGSCHYWYPNYWAGYRWSSPYYWNYACARPHHYRPYPHYASTRWENGRGLRNDRTPNQRVGNGGDPVNTHAGQPIARRDAASRTDYGRQGQVAERPATRSTTEPRVARSASRVRTPSSARTGQSATGRGSTTAIRPPSTSSPIERQFNRERVHARPSYRAPAPTREAAPSGRSSQSAIAPRSSTTQVRTPRTSSSGSSFFRAPASSSTRPSSSFRVPSRSFGGSSAGAGGGRAAAPAGRGGGGGGGRGGGGGHLR